MTAYRWIAWLLLALLLAVGAGAAAVGAVQAPSGASLIPAVTSTLSASSFNEVLVQRTSRGQQSDYLTFQSPDRLGGYIQSGNRRTYVYVIGNFQYQSLTVPANAVPRRLTFYKSLSQGAVALDPAHGYLPYASQAKHVSQSGNTYSFTLTKNGQTGSFTYKVSGQFVSVFNLAVGSDSVRLDISDVGTAPAVRLPAGSRIVSAPTPGG